MGNDSSWVSSKEEEIPLPSNDSNERKAKEQWQFFREHMVVLWTFLPQDVKDIEGTMPKFMEEKPILLNPAKTGLRNSWAPNNEAG